jgi:hypothetical protein
MIGYFVSDQQSDLLSVEALYVSDEFCSKQSSICSEKETDRLEIAVDF